MQRQDLERLSREQLIAHAERLGIARPRVLTQPELIDEIIGRTAKSAGDRTRARGWLGRARDLLANVVEKGLHLPEAARVLRQEDKGWPAPPPPLPTVTLAEIYAAQGHFERAITVLDEVLSREPEHREARALRERFVEQLQRSRSRSGRLEAPPAPPVKEAPVKTAKPVEKREASEKEEAAPPSPRVKPAITKEAVQKKEEAAPPSPRVKIAVAKEAVQKKDEAAPPSPRVKAASLAAPEPARIASEARVVVEAPSAARASTNVVVEVATRSAPVDEVSDAALEAAAATLDASEEPPLPQRYEVDEVVAIAVDPRTIYIYWEIRPTTLAHARAGRPDGQLALRIASVTASWEGPVVDKRDLHVDALYGDRFLRDVQPGSNVRVSIGWKSGAGFEPLAVGAEVTAPRAVPVESVAQDVARWEEPVAPFAAWRPESAGLAPIGTSAPMRTNASGHDPFVPPPAAAPVPWARSIAGALPAGQGAPVDTGVAVWGEPGAAPGDVIGEVLVESAWFVAGGASELSRSGPGRALPVHVPLFGGASELQP
ncbi:Cobalamin biosynthesis protein BluB [Minicystis rosea]|nr:Cobalamin biosynthesis protein BluB [Minicystis rosea]